MRPDRARGDFRTRRRCQPLLVLLLLTLPRQIKRFALAGVLNLPSLALPLTPNPLAKTGAKPRDERRRHDRVARPADP